MLPPAALLARLERRLPLLTGGGRDLPARQQTMRDAIAWSYDLLTPEEQALFRRLAVFVGGFTLEAAEAVGGPSRAPGSTSLDGVASLVDKSLLRQEDGPDGEPRFRMLETVREFGLEQLAASGEADGDPASGTPPGSWRWPRPAGAEILGAGTSAVASSVAMPSWTTCAPRLPGSSKRRDAGVLRLLARRL